MICHPRPDQHMHQVQCANKIYLLQVVTGSEDSYDVPGMAELLFGKATVANSYAAHRLLNEDRTFFKQVNRGPPRFQPRSETEVRSIQAKAAAEAKVRSSLPTPHILAPARTDLAPALPLPGSLHADTRCSCGVCGLAASGFWWGEVVVTLLHVLHRRHESWQSVELH